jgi:hypothetical protein
LETTLSNLGKDQECGKGVDDEDKRASANGETPYEHDPSTIKLTNQQLPGELKAKEERRFL